MPDNNYQIITLVLLNNSLTDIKLDLFNSYRSSERTSTDPTLGKNYLRYQSLGFNTRDFVPLNNSVVFDDKGSLWYYDDRFSFCTVTCKKTPYITLLDFLRSNKLHVKNVRITAEPTQLITPFLVRKYDIFGKYNDMDIFTSTYINPMQVQPNIIEVPFNLVLDGFTTLYYNLGSLKKVALDILCKVI